MKWPRWLIWLIPSLGTTSSTTTMSTNPCDEAARENGFGRPTCVTASVAAQSGPPYRHVLVKWTKNEKGGTINGVFVYRDGSGLMMTPLGANVTEYRDMSVSSGNHNYTVRFSYAGAPPAGGWSEYSDPANVQVP